MDYERWCRVAAATEAKSPAARSYYERRCLTFWKAVKAAITEGNDRARKVVAGSAGYGEIDSATGQPMGLPVRIRTTTRVVGGQLKGGQVVGGRITEHFIVRETQSPDWRAALELLKRRAPQEFGDRMEHTVYDRNLEAEANGSRLLEAFERTLDSVPLSEKQREMLTQGMARELRKALALPSIEPTEPPEQQATE
ncbi:MAG TPA: hypothetical protein VMR97_14425 [Acidimicrobiales bacterium]|nr:hypothetical protein [Acidimicrobiales bacterium]